MTTARDFITLCLKEVGISGVGQSPLAEDINDGFVLLQRMVSGWQRKRWMIPNLVTLAMPGNGLESNTVGTGGYYNYPRPDKILSGYVIQQNTGGNPVSLPLRCIFSREDYNLIAVKSLPSLPTHFFYDNAYPLGRVFLWPVPSAIYTIYLTMKMFIGFDVQIDHGDIVTGGSGYVDGAYVAVPFIGGTGNGASADITVTGGVVSIVTISNPGQDYQVNDILTVDPANLGGSGADFTWKVIETFGSLDSEFNMPPEYEEAIHYNLVVRLCSMYSKPLNPLTGTLAKVALKTIKNANLQLPTMLMPRAVVGRGYGFNLWNADGY